MNKLDLYCGIYYHFRNYGMPQWVLTPIRRLIRWRVNSVLPKYLSTPRNMASKKTEVIVSLTSFPARIMNVWQVVECMLRQSQLPSKILLWLSKEQYPNRDSIPQKLREMENEIFEIRIVDGDIRSHKKYYYACKEYPTSPLLLIDDDIYYPSNFIESMLSTFLKTGRVTSKYGFIIKYKTDGALAPYVTWKEKYSYYEGNDFFLGSGGGVMFIPSRLYKDLLNIDLAMKLTPLADDIWLNAMIRLAGQKIVKIKSGLILPVDNGSTNTTLATHNLSEGGNDRQLRAIEDYYKELGIRVF